MSCRVTVYVKCALNTPPANCNRKMSENGNTFFNLVFRSRDVWKLVVPSDSWRGVWWTQCSHYTVTSCSTRYPSPFISLSMWYEGSVLFICRPTLFINILKWSVSWVEIFRFGSAIGCCNNIIECILFLCPSLPVTVFLEVAQSDTTEHASQSVPMVSTSTPGLVVSGAAGTGEERDDVFLEPDTDRWGSLLSAVYQYCLLLEFRPLSVDVSRFIKSSSSCFYRGF